MNSNLFKNNISLRQDIEFWIFTPSPSADKNAKNVTPEKCVFVESAFNMQYYIVKNILLRTSMLFPVAGWVQKLSVFAFNCFLVEYILRIVHFLICQVS